MPVGHTPPAIVLGGEKSAVPVARSLATAGIEVHAVGGPGDPVRYSRHCASYAVIPEDVGVQVRWLEWMRRAPRGGVVMPCCDDGVELIARNRRTLEELGHVPFEASDEVALAMLDKQRTYELAHAIGLPTPRTASVTGPEDAPALMNEFSLPFAIKPRYAHRARHAGMLEKLLVVRDPGELRDALAIVKTREIEAFATEIVPGDERSLVSFVAYIDERGEPLAQLAIRKIRQFPIHFGVTSYGTTEWEADVAEAGLRFLRGVGLRGPAQVEFKRSAADGDLRLIECNYRFTLLTQLIHCAGIDLAGLVYDRSLGRRPRPVPGPPRDGVRLWLPFQDLRALRGYRRCGELSAGRWMLSLLRRSHLPVFSFSDPLPTLVAFWHFARRAVSRLARKVMSLSGGERIKR